MVAKRYLRLLAALVWGAPGIAITAKGVRAYNDVPQPKLWWLLAITVCVALFFFLIFRRVAGRYIERISALPDISPLYQAFPLKGWLLILFMMGLGISLKFIPFIPIEFTASFYSGLGPMLIVAAVRFLKSL